MNSKDRRDFVESFGFSMLRVASGTGHSIGQVHANGWLIPYYHDPRNEGRVLKKNMVITVESRVPAPRTVHLC